MLVPYCLPCHFDFRLDVDKHDDDTLLLLNPVALNLPCPEIPMVRLVLLLADDDDVVVS